MNVSGDSDSKARSENMTVSGSRNEALATIEIAVLGTIMVMAVVGNASVLLALRKRRHITRMHYFIIHLSIADLIVAFFNILPQLAWDITYRFQGGNGLCKFVKYTQVFAMYLSTYVLLIMAIDRWQAICRPLGSMSWTSKRAHIMAACAWAVALLCSIPQLFLFSYKELPSPNTGEYDCWGTFSRPNGEKGYVIFTCLSLFIFPTAVLVGAYGLICTAVWRNIQAKALVAKPTSNEVKDGITSAANGRNICPRSHGANNLTKAKIKTVKLTFVVVLCYIICWTPYFLSTLWYVVDFQSAYTYLTSEAVAIMMLLASLNSCTNPWIYMAFSGNPITVLRKAWHQRRNTFSSVSRTRTVLSHVTDSRLSSTRTSTSGQLRKDSENIRNSRSSNPFHYKFSASRPCEDMCSELAYESRNSEVSMAEKSRLMTAELDKTNEEQSVNSAERTATETF